MLQLGSITKFAQDLHLAPTTGNSNTATRYEHVSRVTLYLDEGIITPPLYQPTQPPLTVIPNFSSLQILFFNHLNNNTLNLPTNLAPLTVIPIFSSLQFFCFYYLNNNTPNLPILVLWRVFFTILSSNMGFYSQAPMPSTAMTSNLLKDVINCVN